MSACSFFAQIRAGLLATTLTITIPFAAIAAEKPAAAQPATPAGQGAFATDPARLDPPRTGLELDFERTLKRVKEFRGKPRSKKTYPIVPSVEEPAEKASVSLPSHETTKAASAEGAGTKAASGSESASLVASNGTLLPEGALPQPLPPATPAGKAVSQTAKGPVFDKVDRDWGLRPFMKNGYQTLVAPRISFIKRKDLYSEVVEYSWQPLIIKNMPHHERIDRVQFSFNRYYFLGPDRKIFYGGGLGGNIILFNHDLKEWGTRNNINLKDGVNGLGRLFLGYKFREFTFNRWTYPIVFRVDATFSPAYKFGGNLGEAGDRLELTEIKAGLSLGIE